MNTAIDRLAAYRSQHRIALDDSGPLPVCRVDGIRIHPTRPGGWVHDQATILRLHREDVRAMLDAAYPRYVSEIADDGLGQAKAAREDAFERGTLTFEWHGHAVDLDVAE